MRRIQVILMMKKSVAQTMAIAVLVVAGLLVPVTASADTPEVPKSKLVTYLDAHGEWMTSSDYGPVWKPDSELADDNWHPFLNGQWLYTDYGWYWESRDIFGWLTCHHGRWKFIADGDVGWIWIAGEQWASAWVAWRESEDAVGWGALPPSAGGIQGGSPWMSAVPDWQAFLFVPHQRLMAPDISRYATRGNAVTRAISEDARLVTMTELVGEQWSVSGPGLSNLDLPEDVIEVEFAERFPSETEAKLPFMGGGKITAYSPRLDLKKAFAWVPGNLASLDAILLEAERKRRLAQREKARPQERTSQAVPRRQVNRELEQNPEPREKVVVREVVREPVVVYEEVVSNVCPSNCHCSKCRPEPRPPKPGERYPGNNAQYEQRQRQLSAQEAQRQRQRAAQERARQGRDPSKPRVPLGPGL